MKLILPLLLAFFIFSCQSKLSQQKSKASATTEKINQLPKNHTQEIVAYQGATVYAGATDYYFTDRNGETVSFRVSNIPIEERPGETDILLPNDLLDPSEIIEGPPGPNPAKVGTSYLLIKNEKAEILELRNLAPKNH